jgi:pilus assembly protein FimV
MADSGAGRDSMPAGMGDAPAAADSMTDGMGAGDSGASAELAAQVNRMTERLDTLEEIVALKDEQIAALQQSLREAREAAAAPAAAAPAASAPAAPAPAAQRPAAPAARPAASSELPWLPIGGGVAVILGLLALFLVRRRNKDVPGSELPQRGRADDDVFAGVKLKKEALADDQTASEAIAANAANAVDAAEGGEVELSLADPDAGMEPLETAGGSRGYGERKHDDYIDEGAAGDALAEADIYIAYGRYLQAIELLDTAIEEEPDNSAYRLKLIELYVDMGEDDNAVAQLDMLRAGGDREAILRGEALVGGTAAPSSAPSAPPPAPAPDPLDPMEMDTLPEVEAGPDADPAPRMPEPEPESELDLEAAPVADDVAEELPLDLEPGSEEVVAAAPPVADDEDLDAPADMEFDELQIEEDSSDGEEQLDLMADDDDGEEELDLSDALAAMEAVEARHADSESDSDDGGDSSGDEFLTADDADQMATKLDLARAYLDMGDGDGARGILEEVISAGTAEQQQEARELLSRVD